MTPKPVKAALVFYCVIAVAVFGHAWVNQPAERVNMFDGRSYPVVGAQRIIVAVFAATTWPMYMSIKFWEQQK